MEQNKLRVSIFLVIIAIVAGITLFAWNGFAIYKKLYIPNVHSIEKKHIYINKGSTLKDVIAYFEEEKVLINIESFKWAAEKMGLEKQIHPGHYILKIGFSNNRIINLLKAGLQEPIKVTFNSVNTIEEFSKNISLQIEADSQQIYQEIMSNDFLNKYGYNKNTVLAAFIPNTYEFYWNTDALKFLEKMQKERSRFWNEERRQKAQLLKLSELEVSILASIVYKESQYTAEMPTIAGVYLNRIRIGMPLQADPTIKFLVGNSIKRILRKHLDIESPYNTYKNKGLPPGPICIPDIKAIDAVLNAKEHKFLYFCAKEDFSGKHNFSKTLSEHNRNARLYQDALNKRNIYK